MSARLAWPLAALSLLAAGCEPRFETDPDPDSDSDTGVGTDTDPGTDSDPDSGTDGIFECEAEPIASLPFALNGTAFRDDYPNAENWSAGRGCVTSQGAEAVFEVSLSAGQELVVQESGTVDVVIHVKADCDPLAACLASADDSVDDRLEWTVPATGTYWVIVEGWSTNAQGTWSIAAGEVDPEDCDDGVDNDLDGLVDCADTGDCFDTPECPFTCPADEAVSLPYTLSGSDMANESDDGDYGSGSGCADDDAGERIIELALSAGQTVRVTETEGADLTLSVMDTCLPGDACLDSESYSGTLDFTAPASGTYYVVVGYDDFWSYDSAWSVDVAELLPEDCDNGADDDLDGESDCDDLDCFNTTECPFDCPADEMVFAAGAFSAFGTSWSNGVEWVGPYADGDGCTTGSGEARVWEVEMAPGSELRLTENGSMDAVWRVLEDCAPTSDCLLSSDTDTNRVFRSFEGGTYYVVLESYSSGSTGSWDAFVRYVPPEDCASAGDEDGDGAADCADVDCVGVGSCAWDCPAVDVGPTGLAAAGNDFTADFTNAWPFATGAGCTASGAGAEAIYRVPMVAGQTIVVREEGGIDVSLRLQTGCRPADECVVDQGSPETLRYTASEDETVYVVVEAAATSPSTRDYDLTIAYLEPEDCEDGVDNDDDGRVDCADVDCGVACGALLAEGFEAWPPPGWTVQDGGATGTDSSGDPLTWYACEGACGTLDGGTGLVGASGAYAYVDSNVGSGAFDDSLATPPIDLSGLSSATLKFTHYYNDFSTDDSAAVEISTNGGTSWAPVQTWTSDSVNGAVASVNLGAYVGQTVRLRFRYVGNFDWYWAIDDVVVTGN